MRPAVCLALWAALKKFWVINKFALKTLFKPRWKSGLFYSCRIYLGTVLDVYKSPKNYTPLSADGMTHWPQHKANEHRRNIDL